MLTIDIITLFPSMFSGPFAESIIKRAQNRNLVQINIHNLRNWAIDKRGTVDDRPYGGGKGMILRPEPLFGAVENIKKLSAVSCQLSTVLLTPQGQTFNQQKAEQLAQLGHIILICGHYEGVDERVRKHLVDEGISIGDYILTGGEIPAMVVTDAVVRLIPGVLEKKATAEESFQDVPCKGSTLEYPQYTHPKNFRGWKVPEILLSGNHKEIKKWRRRKAIAQTHSRRPDLMKNSSAV